MRLIDSSRFIRDLTLDTSKGFYGEFVDGSEVAYTSREIDKAIRDTPTISAVPVVRCRECKRWSPDPDSYGKDDGPKGKCMKSFEDTYSDDFCSYGERKTETVLPKSDTKDESLEADHEVSG